MNELIFFKYFMVRICDDRLYFERIRTKPVMKILSDIFINKVIVAPFSVVAFFALMMYASGIKIHQFIPLSTCSLVICIVTILMIYHEQRHRNSIIRIKHIKKIYFDKRKNILKMEYILCNKFLRIKIVDLPDNEIKINNIINKLNNAGLVCESVC